MSSTAPLSPTAPDALEAVDDFELIGDDLDSLLDSAPNGQDEPEVPISVYEKATFWLNTLEGLVENPHCLFILNFKPTAIFGIRFFFRSIGQVCV